MFKTNTILLNWVSFALFFCCASTSFGQSVLYTEGPGVNPAFEEIRDSISNGFGGTIIDVNNELVEGGAFGDFDIQGDLNLHTLANSSIGESNHDNWSRWYQTDGKTQVFRLFPEEENVRNSRPLAARTEIFDTNTAWNVSDGEWNEWVGRYTIIKPINASIFQAKDRDDEAWSVHLNMREDGRVLVTHRRPLPGQPKTETLIENAIGQPFDVRVRDNGLDYEVYLGNSAAPFTTGQYVRNSDPNDDSDTRFRWGIYVGAQEVPSEALVFVSHASVNPILPPPDPVIPPEYGSLIAGWETWTQVTNDVWNPTQTSGVSALAVGQPEEGGTWFNFNNADVENGASSDGDYGEMGHHGASVSVASTIDGVTLSNGYDGYIDFTLTETSGQDIDLTGFHFDVGAFRPSAATEWELIVLEGSDITEGSVALGTASVNAGPMQDDESIDLTGIADSTLEANGTVTFRLNFTGGGGELGDHVSGHHIFLDNVGVSGIVADISGDYNGDGIVDAADFVIWRNGNSPDSTIAGYNLWRENFGTGTTVAAASASEVPEPGSVMLLVFGTLIARSFTNKRRRNISHEKSR